MRLVGIHDVTGWYSHPVQTTGLDTPREACRLGEDFSRGAGELDKFQRRGAPRL